MISKASIGGDQRIRFLVDRINGSPVPLYMGSAFVLALVIAAFISINSMLPLGPDWHLVFYRIPNAYLAGETRLFDAQSVGWYNPPWLLPLLFPFAVLPEMTGLMLYRFLSLAIIIYCAFTLSSRSGWRKTGIVMVLMSFATLEAVQSGNIDAFVLLGLVILWRAVEDRRPYLLGFSLLLLTLKPQLALLSCYGEYNVSFYYVLFKVPNLLGLPSWLPLTLELSLICLILWRCWKFKDLEDRLALSVGSAPVVMPYVCSISLVMPMVAGWPRLLERRLYSGALFVYALYFLVLLRLDLGYWVLSFFSLGLTLALMLSRGARSQESTFR